MFLQNFLLAVHTTIKLFSIIIMRSDLGKSNIIIPSKSRFLLYITKHCSSLMVELLMFTLARITSLQV